MVGTPPDAFASCGFAHPTRLRPYRPAVRHAGLQAGLAAGTVGAEAFDEAFGVVFVLGDIDVAAVGAAESQVVGAFSRGSHRILRGARGARRYQNKNLAGLRPRHENAANGIDPQAVDITPFGKCFQRNGIGQRRAVDAISPQAGRSLRRAVEARLADIERLVVRAQVDAIGDALRPRRAHDQARARAI